MKTYTIYMKNCAFFARHGFFDEEAFLGQRFFVDARLDVEADYPLEEDKLDGTVDYGLAFKVIEAAVLGQRRYLIEALAADIAIALCAKFSHIRRAEVTVRKPNAPVPGVLDYVEVTVVHEP